MAERTYTRADLEEARLQGRVDVSMAIIERQLRGLEPRATPCPPAPDPAAQARERDLDRIRRHVHPLAAA